MFLRDEFEIFRKIHHFSSEPFVVVIKISDHETISQVPLSCRRTNSKLPGPVSTSRNGIGERRGVAAQPISAVIKMTKSTAELWVGIFMALPIVISGRTDIIALAAEPFHGKPGLLALGAIALMLYRVARK